MVKGQVEAADVALAPARRVAHQRAIDGDVVGFQVAQHVLVGGLAAVFLAVGDDVDDAPALLGPRGKLLGRGQDRVVEGMNLFGDGDERSAASGTAGLQVGIDAVAVFAYIAAGQAGRC